MSKLSKVTLYAAKQYAREQEQKRKATEKEAIKREKERLLKQERANKYKEYIEWLSYEEIWKRIFDGNLPPEINWSEKTSPRDFKPPRVPQTENVLKEIKKNLQKKYNTRLIFALILFVGFLLSFDINNGLDQGIFSITGTILTGIITGVLFLNRHRKIKCAIEDANTKKQVLDKEYEIGLKVLKHNYELNEKNRIDKVEALMKGEDEAVRKTALRFLEKKNLLKEKVIFDIQVKNSIMELNITCPGLEVISDKVVDWNPEKWTLKKHRKSLLEKVKHYERLIAAITLQAGWEVLRTCPTVNEVYLVVHTLKYHRTKGTAYNACILSCILNKKSFKEINFKKVEYLHALENFPLRFNSRGKELPGDVYPHMPGVGFDVSPDVLQLDIDTMNGKQFEDFVKILVDKMGFITEKTKDSHDGGIDIWAFSDHALVGGRYIIQCKRWTPTIPVEIVRELYGTVTREQADKGILIATSKISSDCYKFVKDAPHKVPISLISGTELRSLITQYGLAK